MDFDEILTRGVAELITESELREKLASGKKLRLKQGFDPSKPDLHIGHAIGLRKLRQLQDLGHEVVLIVGDKTAQIGDPSGRDESRTMLTHEEVKENAETYMRQFFHFMDEEKTEVRWQSEWFDSFGLQDIFSLASKFTMAQMMTHNTFRNRVDEGLPLSMVELMYPMLQAYDSVAIEADVEFGGTDQKFNILAGRELQQQMGQVPQNVFLIPLLPGTDGRKMSKTFDNTIDVTMEPDQIFGKIMSISDEMIQEYFELTTDVPLSRIAEIGADLSAGRTNPMEYKKELGVEIVSLLRSREEAAAAKDAFERQFSQRIIPGDIPSSMIGSPVNIVDYLLDSGMAPSKSHARRLIKQNAVSYIIGSTNIDDKVMITDPEYVVKPAKELIIKAGKRNYRRAG